MKPENEQKLEVKLRRHRLIKGIHYEDIHMVGSADGKIKCDYEIFIDDNPEMVKQMKDYPRKKLLLFDQPWNRHINTRKYKNVARVMNWREVWEKIRRFL